MPVAIIMTLHLRKQHELLSTVSAGDSSLCMITLHTAVASCQLQLLPLMG